MEIEMAFRDEPVPQHGVFHARVLRTIAEPAGGDAVFPPYPAEVSALTAEFKPNRRAAVAEGVVRLRRVS